jgi:hypothetical protein
LRYVISMQSKEKHMLTHYGISPGGRAVFIQKL